MRSTWKTTRRLDDEASSTTTEKPTIMIKKATLFALLAATLSALVSGCGDDGESSSADDPTAAANTAPATPDEPAEPSGPTFHTTMMGMEMSQPLVSRTLDVEGFEGLTIVAPEDARIEENRGRARVLSAGVNYSVAIRSGAFDAEGTKRIWGIIDAEGTVVEETDDLVMYQRSNDGGMLFEVGVMLGEQAYTCSTVVTAFQFTREQIDQMVTSCRTLGATDS